MHLGANSVTHIVARVVSPVSRFVCLLDAGRLWEAVKQLCLGSGGFDKNLRDFYPLDVGRSEGKDYTHPKV